MPAMIRYADHLATAVLMENCTEVKSITEINFRSLKQWGRGKTPPKAARIRHPKIPPLNCARGEESPCEKGVTKKQNFQSTNSVPP
ncbi:hypothetical protein TNCV_4148411 [Trichonephila clavipes]|nr:hypothetical protein TNCV_4148411 [Trichonephila clavipes]